MKAECRKCKYATAAPVTSKNGEYYCEELYLNVRGGSSCKNFTEKPVPKEELQRSPTEGDV